MAPKQGLRPNLRELSQLAKQNTVGFVSGAMPARMKNAKANDMDSYKSRFETMGLGSGGAIATQAKTLQANAMAIAQKAQALGEAAGLGGARVPIPANPAKTAERMLDKFVNSKVGISSEAGPERERPNNTNKDEKKVKKNDKKGKHKKDKKKDKKTRSKKEKKKKEKKRKKEKKQKSSSSSSEASSSSSSSADEKALMDESQKDEQRTKQTAKENDKGVKRKRDDSSSS